MPADTVGLNFGAKVGSLPPALSDEPPDSSCRGHVSSETDALHPRWAADI
jgi:hypothetical protein